jgi:BlaI family penicillinase repressor
MRINYMGVNSIKLTDKELQIMAVLWDCETAMTAAEIVGATKNKTWKENSIYIILNSMLKKGAVKLTLHKPTGTNNARAYRPLIAVEDCVLSHIASIEESGASVDIPVLVKRLMSTHKTEG